MNTPEILNAALQFKEHGYSIIATVEKKAAFPWKKQQETIPPDGQIVSWFGAAQHIRYNVAVVCGQVSGWLVVLDIDDKQRAREFYRKYKAILKTIVETRRGAHLWFRGDVNTTKFDGGDVKGPRSYVLAPPSKVDGWEYKFVPGHPLVQPSELPPFPDNLIEKKEVRETRIEENDRLSLIARAMKYGETVEGAVSGQHGHNATFRFCCKLVRRFGLTENEAWPILLYWNTKCSPPWQERDLRRKLREAMKE